MATINPATSANPAMVQSDIWSSIPLSSLCDSKTYDLVVGKIMPIIAATLAVGCLVAAVAINPFIAVGLIPLVALAILGVTYANKEWLFPADWFSQENLRTFLPSVLIPEAPFVPNQPIGLSNEGNNCWANSLVQLALNNPVLEAKLRYQPPFRSVFDGYRQAQTAQNRVATTVSTQKIREYLHHYTNGLISLAPTQEDVTVAMERTLGESAPGGALYTFEHFNRTMNERAQRVEHVIGLALETGVSFDTLFQRFFNEITDRGQSIQLSFHRPPETLLIQLRRFYQTGRTDRPEFGTRNDYAAHKDNGLYPVTLSLTLPASCSLTNQEARYECDGFIEHIGSSPHGGHYVAYIKRAGKWWYCSDSTVTEASLSTVQSAIQRSFICSYRKL